MVEVRLYGPIERARLSKRDDVHIRPVSGIARPFVYELWGVRPTQEAARRLYPDGRHGLSIDLTTGEAHLEPAVLVPHITTLAPGAPRVGARLALGAVRGLFDVDPDWGADRLVLTDLAPDFAPVLDALRADPHDAVATLDRWLRARAARAPRPSRALAAAAHLLTHPQAAPRVRDVADAIGYSVRQLQRRFRAEVGLTPKQIAQIHRARLVRAHITAHPDRGLAEIAAELGFADQAQMTRLFARYCGTTPGRYRRRKQHPAG